MRASNYVKVWHRAADSIDAMGIQQPGHLIQDVRAFTGSDHRDVHLAVQWAEREVRRLAKMGREARIAVWRRLGVRPQWPAVGQQKAWN